MTYEEESYVLNSIKQIKHEVHENNVMLKAIIKYLATESAHANEENMNDFGRNILANMVSNIFELNGLFRR